MPGGGRISLATHVAPDVAESWCMVLARVRDGSPDLAFITVSQYYEDPDSTHDHANVALQDGTWIHRVNVYSLQPLRK